MAGRTPTEAVEEFLLRLRASAGTITKAQLVTSRRGKDPHGSHSVTFGPPSNVGPLATLDDRPRLHLQLAHYYTVVETDDPERGPWKVHTTGYLYSLVDAEGDELLNFHWHPDGQSPYKEPHVQIGSGVCPSTWYPKIGRAHIPSPRTSLEQVIRIALDAFEVQPLRPNWEQILQRNHDAFMTWKTR